jgi:hypothetical protein
VTLIPHQVVAALAAGRAFEFKLGSSLSAGQGIEGSPQFFGSFSDGYAHALIIRD